MSKKKKKKKRNLIDITIIKFYLLEHMEHK